MSITPEEAWRRLEAGLEPLDAVRVERRRAAGRVLAEPLTATVDVPATDVSAMDGYALPRPAAAGDRLPVAGTIAAGDRPGRSLGSGEALRIMTGAPVPAGAATVVPVELTDGGTEEVSLTAGIADGMHIRRRGEIQRAGDPLLPAGHPLTPGALALLATHGHSEVAVHRAPRVAIVVTGDEVVPADRTPGPGQLRDSHSDFLAAACDTLGVEVESLGIAPDEPGELARRITAGLEADLLLVSGGVSMGEFDFVEGVLADAGCRTLFDSVAIQPGKPLVAARSPSGYVIGLPGNPGSVMACFWLFVRPLVRRLMGRVDRFWHGALPGRLTGPLPPGRDRDRFLPASATSDGGPARVEPKAPRGSHDLGAFAHGSALVRVRAGAPAAAAEDPCEYLPIGG